MRLPATCTYKKTAQKGQDCGPLEGGWRARSSAKGFPIPELPTDPAISIKRTICGLLDVLLCKSQGEKSRGRTLTAVDVVHSAAIRIVGTVHILIRVRERVGCEGALKRI